MRVQCVLFNIHRMFHITNICFYVWMKCLWCSCLCLRVLKEKAWAPSLSRYPAATWSSEQLQNQTVRHKHTERVLCVTAASVFINPVMCAGRCWMDALELALKCSSLLKRTMVREGREETTQTAEHSHINFYSLLRAHNMQGFQ